MIDDLSAYKKELEELEKRFEHSHKKCAEQVAKLKDFIIDLAVVFGCVADNSDVPKAKQSLVFLRFLQSMLHLNELPFLLMAGHYTSGIHILRYRLESMVQALYLDQRHPALNLENKICILAEISDKREYFLTRLIDEITIDNKGNLRETYKDLSIASHPSHLDFPTINQMIEHLKTLESTINCNELNRVVDLTIRTYDIIFFLVLQSFPSAKEAAKNQPYVKKVVEKYNLPLLHKVL